MCFFIKNYEKKIAKLLIKKSYVISTAESCTGGLISSMLTDVSGSSAFVKANFVTYANEAKERYLFVQKETLTKYGAVSEQTAFEMAKGLIAQTKSDIALGITGIAGPTGGTAEKPVGLAYVGITNGNKILIKKIKMPSFLPRKFMKYCFAKMALCYLNEFLEEENNDRT